MKVFKYIFSLGFLTGVVLVRLLKILALIAITCAALQYSSGGEFNAWPYVVQATDVVSSYANSILSLDIRSLVAYAASGVLLIFIVPMLAFSDPGDAVLEFAFMLMGKKPEQMQIFVDRFLSERKYK